MYTIPAFGPWPEQNAGPDEEKRLNSAQQSKTSPTSIDREHETGVFYGSGKLPYQTSPCRLHLQRFCETEKALQAYLSPCYGAWDHPSGL